MHECNNYTCQFLNPSIEKLITYEDLKVSVIKVENNFHSEIINLGKVMASEITGLNLNFPLDLWGWANIHMIYQIPNLEFVHGLAKFIKDVDAKTILEVGAGRGIISRHISKIIDQEIILTDDYSWWKNINKDDKMDNIEYTDIIKMKYKDAIKKFNPDLIIASWIPYGEHWTGYFRNHRSVKGYILIGEPAGGCTGSQIDWNTNWKRKNLADVERFGICRTDHGLEHGHAILHTDVTYFSRPEEMK